MKEPQRLFESGSALEKSILGFGRDEAPSPDLARKTLAAISASPPSPEPQPWRPRLGAAAAGTVGAGAVVALALLFGSSDPRPDAPAPPPPAVATNAAPAIDPPAVPEADPEVVVTPDSLPNAPARSAISNMAPSPAPPAPPVRPAGTASIAREVELLDGVKSRLAAGDPAEAARTLAAYDLEFPNGTLRPEATVLRIRTLLARGDRGAAEKLGSEFLAAHPTGVHAKRVRALLGRAD